MCHECTAGTQDKPFEDGSDYPKWALSRFTERPFAVTPILCHILFAASGSFGAPVSASSAWKQPKSHSAALDVAESKDVILSADWKNLSLAANRKLRKLDFIKFLHMRVSKLQCPIFQSSMERPAEPNDPPSKGTVLPQDIKPFEWIIDYRDLLVPFNS